MNSKTHAAVASWITAQQDERYVSDLGVGRDMHTPLIDAKPMPVQCMWLVTIDDGGPALEQHCPSVSRRPHLRAYSTYTRR